ncbi:MAG TPA: hypothetical protein PLT28_00345 [Saprospiraceae bacterium]|nr:hypothetical protein [Saprospiraceae bacterium]
MKIIEKYTGTATYMFPNGEMATPEYIRATTPAVDHFPYIVETDENHQVMFSLQNLSAMRGFYNIDAGLTEEEAIAAIQELANAEPPVETDPESSPEERIAAALEYSNLLSMEVVNTEDPDTTTA